jgi:hypothetical protein
VRVAGTATALAVLAAAAASFAAAPLLDARVRARLATVSAERLRADVTTLGADAMEGRGTGTAGERAAARYLAAALAVAGVRGGAPDGGFLQPVPVHGTRPLPESDLLVVTPSETRALAFARDYFLFSGGLQTHIPQPVPLVFVGYGIVAPEFDYDDYEGIDVAGTVVVFLAGEPPSSDRAFFAGERTTVYAAAETKQRIASSRGARGSILLGTPAEARWRDWEWVARQFAFEQLALAYGVPKHFAAVLHPAAAELLFCDARHTLAEVIALAATHSMRSFPLAASVRFRGAFAQRDVLAANVVGRIDGRDPALRATHLVLSAHYDHLGIGSPVGGDAIYNGVGDNALGVAAVLEVARVLAAEPPPRSLVILLTTGEEHGLLGSSYYADHPVAPLATAVANLNVDGIAFFDEVRDFVGVGGELSTLGRTLERVAGELGLAVSPVPALLGTFDPFLFSDQQAFAEAGVPSILVAEGFDTVNRRREDALRHAIRWSQTIYHTPFDDLSQPLNYAAAAQHTRVVLALAAALASDAKAPEWLPGVRHAQARRLSRLDRR